jgi:hypothetical protein
MAKKPKKTTKEVFKVGDLVLARVRGHPLWPARVTAVINKNKYEVEFFQTKDTSKSIVEILPFNSTTKIDPKLKKPLLIAAYKECQEQYEKTIDNNRQAKLDAQNSESNGATKDEDGSSPKLEIISPEDDHSPQTKDSPPEEDHSAETKDSSPDGDHSPQTKDSSPDGDHSLQTKDSSSDTAPSPEPKNPSADEPKAEETSPVDCSLNDLTSEQANADRRIKKSFPKSENTQVTNKVKTIEKLKKKLQKKLDEKEDKKKHRREKKEFEKASNILPKFILKFQSVTEAGGNFVKNSNDTRNAIQLKTSMKNCEKCLDLLTKCVTALSSEYGRVQKESKDFHASLSEMVCCLRDIKIMNIKPMSKDAKHFLSEMKYREPIKEFINGFESTSKTKEIKEELIVERKENARKRLKLTR